MYAHPKAHHNKQGDHLAFASWLPTRQGRLEMLSHIRGFVYLWTLLFLWAFWSCIFSGQISTIHTTKKGGKLETMSYPKRPESRSNGPDLRHETEPKCPMSIQKVLPYVRGPIWVKLFFSLMVWCFLFSLDSSSSSSSSSSSYCLLPIWMNPSTVSRFKYGALQFWNLKRHT